MRKNVIICVLAALIGWLLPVVAEACYSPREVEAEQGIRIHSELMVIGMTCAKMPQGRDLYNKYQIFTSRNSGIISEYEADMIAYYTRMGASNPEQRFHSLRASLANTISRQAVSMSVGGFCQQFAPRLDQALAMDEDTLRRWARQVWPGQTFPEPLCQ